MFLFITTTIVIETKACKSENEYTTNLFYLLTILYAVIGFLFLVSGITMAISLRKYYPSFYKDYGKFVWIATFCLAVPLFYRAINDIYSTHERYLKYYFNHFALVNCLFVSVSSILPVVS
jgi:predicted small integral membrane protein